MVQKLKPFGVCITPDKKNANFAVKPEEVAALVKREKLVLFRGFKLQRKDSFLFFCRRYPGKGLVHWDSGPVMEMRETPDAQNYLKSNERVPFHWDGAFQRVPSVLVFSCVEAPLPGGGGETLFCDTTQVWRDASPDLRTQWARIKVQYKAPKLAHYGGEIMVPLMCEHPGTGAAILRFAEPVKSRLNPVQVKVFGDPSGEAIETLIQRLYSAEYCVAHTWEKGDLLLCDNHALLHGRHAFTKGSPRHLRRVQIL